MGEVFVCDTSVVVHLFRRRLNPDHYERWDEFIAFARLRKTALAISAVTVAEFRAGALINRWGPRRVRAADLLLGELLQLPVDRPSLDEWARLRAAARCLGVAISDNDLWIAAAASVREHVLVTCDRDHERIAGEMPVEVVLLAPPA
jgi:predicted nucleic acid-binding protein